jgi:hypothetical protein
MSADTDEPRIGWTQPLCDACYAAWSLGRGEVPREPHFLVRDEGEPCLICGTPTTIYTRIDPNLAAHFPHPKVKDA